MMNDLQQHLDRLFSFVRQSTQPLSWTRVLIVEDTAITHGEFLFIPRSALTTVEAYTTQFEAHLNAGHSWINMNAAGVVGDTLLVIIELPQYTNTVPKERVSVNLSGPSIRTANQIQIAG
jgi:hypothetical protein